MLIVERELLVARDIQSRLGRLGYQVAGAASNGREAVSMALAIMPDLILIDLDLGGDMEGIEVVIKIIKSAFFPVIFCAARAKDTFIERAAQLSSSGYSFGYLQKPFGNHELQISIKLALSRHGMERALAARVMYLDAMLDSIGDGIVVADTAGRIMLSNLAAEKIIGVDRHTAFNLRLDELVKTSAFRQDTAKPPAHDGFTVPQQCSGIRQWLWRQDERQVPVELSVHCPDASLTVLSLRDISEQLAHEENLRRDAFHTALFDDLTGLPNRALFIERLKPLVSGQQNRPVQFAILLLGIDELSAVNDSLGREVGALVIKEVGNRIASTLAETQPTATVARYDEDIFAVLLDSLDTPDPIATSALVSHQILAALHRPLSAGDTLLNLRVSVGMAVKRDEPASADEMLRDASLRLYQAQSGAKPVEDEMSVNTARFTSRQHRLQQALLEGGFEVHYQPVLNLAEGKLVGLEALLKWQDPSHDTVLYDPVTSVEFAPIAEATGLSLPLGRMMMQEVCDQIRQWQNLEFQNINVAINLNESQFEIDMVALVWAALNAAGIEPARLGLNITEEVAVNIQRGSRDNLAQEGTPKLRMLKKLQASGVKISIDNFGIGRASLSHIRRLPLTGVKIDPSLIDDITRRKDAAETVFAINALAHSLKLTVLARGVTTAEQADALQDCGCDYAQGSFYTSPVPAAEMTEYLKNYYDA